jgi:nitroreductase
MSLTALTRAELEDVVSAAISAPSVLNTQPWRFRAKDDVIDVIADLSRALPHLDPDARELLVSCGAALMNLRLAIASHGREPVVRLLPHPTDPGLLARVRIAGHRVATPIEKRLAEAIPLRRTSREPFRPEPVPSSVVEALVAAAEVEGARLDVAAGWTRTSLAGFVRDADLRQRGEPAVVADVDAWTRHAPEGSGIPAASMGPRADDPQALVRDFAMGRAVEARPDAHFDDPALLAVLLTERDGAADRLRGGQALERVLLTATAEGLSTSLLTQPAEVSALRQLLRDPVRGVGWPQAILRLGYGPQPPQTPRRPVSEVLDVG